MPVSCSRNATNAGRAELLATAVQGRPPGVGLGVGVLGLVDVEVALPELVARSPGTRRRPRRTPPGRARRRARRAGTARRGAVLLAQVRSSSRLASGRGSTSGVVMRASMPRVRSQRTRSIAPTPVRAESATLESHAMAARIAAGRPPAPRVGVLVVAYNAAGDPGPDARPAAAVVPRRRSTTCWSATTPARTTPTSVGLRLPGGHRPAADRRAPPAEPRLRRQPEGRLPLGDRARPRHRRAAARRRPVRPRGASRTSSRRWRRARPTPCSARG